MTLSDLYADRANQIMLMHASAMQCAGTRMRAGTCGLQGGQGTGEGEDEDAGMPDRVG
jgi:hypothetical protein